MHRKASHRLGIKDRIRLFSNSTNLPERAWLAVAIRLSMWDWGRGPRDQYFGVPYANFWVWFWVVFTFSVGLWAFADPATWAGRWLAPVGAILLRLVNLIAMNSLMTWKSRRRLIRQPSL
jgi:hypothetical protein